MADKTALQDLPETPAGYAARWTAEFAAAKDNLKDFHELGDRIIDRYLDKKGSARPNTRLNLFTANTQTMESLLFGKTPQVDAERRYADSADDVARVAAEITERLLNTDLEKDSDTQQEAFRNALGDRLKPGLAMVRLRYEVGETEMQPGKPAAVGPDGQPIPGTEVPEVETRPNERVDVDYVYWKDVLWSPARTFSETRWWAFANDMPEDRFIERFGEEKKALFVPTQRDKERDKTETYKDPMARCRVWEIWSKDRKTVDWFIEGATETVDHKDDPLDLEGFWPFPRPMVANLTTTKFLPTPDFHIAQDLYDTIDVLESRISLLEEAIRVAGVYDTTNDGIKKLISEKGENKLYPVNNWHRVMGEGGVEGAISWLPLDTIVGALDKLRECRTEKIGLLYQVTGMSDIMRGQASQQTTATEQAIKARFASVRVQSLQDEFARFCSDTQRIKAEIISKHFDRNTILRLANVKYMVEADQQFAGPAVDLILSGEFDVRISVNPDSVSLTDFAALKQERTEFAGSLATYFQGMMPMIQALGAVGAGAPAIEFTLRMGQALAAGLKGSSEMEGIFDEFISELEALQKQQAANPQPPQEDPQLQVEKIKAGVAQQKADDDKVKSVLDLKVAQQKHTMEMQKMHAQQHMGAQKMAMDQHIQGRQMENQEKQMDMEQEAAQADHSRSMQSAEAKERLEGVKAVNKVTGGDK